ncbi:MAG: protein kinase [Chloroflexota bacterium]
MAKIFISYSRQDIYPLKDLVNSLREHYGADILWYDKEGLSGGDDWWARIISEIEQCHLFIFLVSIDSLKSKYCIEEFEKAMSSECFILPIHVRPTKLPYPEDVKAKVRTHLSVTQHVDISSGIDSEIEEELFESIDNLLKKYEATQEEIPSRGYEIIKQIAIGGYSHIYLATQNLLNRKVAIKVILPAYERQSSFMQRFQQEAELVARLEHPHIVPLYDYWHDRSGAYLVMRYIPGSHLASKLEKEGAMPPEKAVQLLNQISGALALAHRKCIVHQDINPTSILFDEDDNAYLTEFGIAHDIERGINLSVEENNTMYGSPKYISPEQVRKKATTPQSDIYSLGILMWEVLTGKPPFDHENILQLLQMHVQSELPPLQEVNPDLPEQLNLPLRRATHKDIEQRYKNVSDFARDFKALVTVMYNDLTDTNPASQLIKRDDDSTDLSKVINPYKGLNSFRESDADYFLGRSALTKRLMKAMTDTSPAGRFLAVVGPSGSGKSSVVRAVLIPALRRGEIMGLPTQYISSMVPGVNPMRSLEGAVLKIGVKASIEMMETISKDEYDLNAVLHEALPKNGEMLLLIDQFEEIFTLVDDGQKRLTFLKMIYNALMAENSRLRVVVTMRANFLDRTLQYPGWNDLFQNRVVSVPVMTDNEL